MKRLKDTAEHRAHRRPIGRPLPSRPVRLMSPALRASVQLLARQYIKDFTRGVAVPLPQDVAAELVRAIAEAATGGGRDG